MPWNLHLQPRHKYLTITTEAAERLPLERWRLLPCPYCALDKARSGSAPFASLPQQRQHPVWRTDPHHDSVTWTAETPQRRL